MKSLLAIMLLTSAICYGQKADTLSLKVRSIQIHSSLPDTVYRDTSGERDTIILGSAYYGYARRTRFIVPRRHYQRAAYICQLSLIPYSGLNGLAQRELDEGRWMILKQEDIK
jgi:hypothetical protein